MTREFTFPSPIGLISFEFLEPNLHARLIHSWVSQPYAAFWGMQGQTETQVAATYAAQQAKSGFDIFIGSVDGEPKFLMERYCVSKDPLASCYQTAPGDIGMHLLIAPTEHPVSGFSKSVMQSVMAFLFSDETVKRVVVEPDHRNSKIHKLNKHVGFFHEKRIQLGEKTAFLATCTRAQFLAVSTLAERVSKTHLAENAAGGPMAMVREPALAVEALRPDIWRRVNRHLIRKALAELSHERILEPRLIAVSNTQSPQESKQANAQNAGEEYLASLSHSDQTYQLNVDTPNTCYRFRARLLSLDHWLIDADSIERWVDEQPAPLDAIAFVLDIRSQLGIAKERFPIYLEEITSTLCSAAYKQHKPHLSAAELATADFQTIEMEMTEGHPCFIANNGRIGFDAADFRAFAPEAGAPITLMWLAAHKSRAHFASAPDLDYEQLLNQELDITTREQFEQILKSQGLNPGDYWLIPVHPWQWFNKLASVYAPEIAAQNLVMLGYGDDAYFAQQSIRTFFNASQPHKRYVKTALSILNMGFMRGLSAYYMRATPAINQWLRDLVDSDTFLASVGFDMLREVASVGYEIPYYDRALVGDNPYRRMLAALWRENPLQRIKPGQRLMTMAAFLHQDEHANALLPALISASGLAAEQWLKRYLRAYLTPLLHCFYRYKLVFMPHGENLIMVMENHVPVGVLMKDIGEEICLQNSDAELPETVERIKISLPEDMEPLAIFTDIFDCYFRFMAAILEDTHTLLHTDFWRLVAECVHDYQAEFPEQATQYKTYDLFAQDFSLSCLNRLQLKNNLQMVNLEDPADSLTFSGKLANPLAPFRNLRAEKNQQRERALA